MYRLEIKESEDKYYNSLYNLCLDNPSLGVSKKTLRRYSFKESYIADDFTITKIKVKTSSRLTRIAWKLYLFKCVKIQNKVWKPRKSQWLN